MKKEKEEFYTALEAANKLHITRHSFYMAIKMGKLKARKIAKQWMISKSDLYEYRINKYVGDNRKLNGEPVFSIEKGHFSVSPITEIFAVELNRTIHKHNVYELIKKGRLRAYKKGTALVITRQDAQDFIERERFSDMLFHKMAN